MRSGTLLRIEGDDLVIDSRGTEIRLVLRPDTDFWEGTWVSEIPPRVGDHLLATGSASADGRFVVDRYYANVQNILGPILTVDGSRAAPIRLTIRDRYDIPFNTPYVDGGHAVLIDPRSLLIGPPDRDQSAPMDRPAEGERLDLAVRQRLQVVGREIDGVVVAVTVFLM